MKTKKLDRKKALAIAKDVLLNLKSGKYIAETGNYIYLDLPLDKIHLFSNGISRSAVKSSNGCFVCAIGSAIVSSIRIYGRKTPSSGRWPGWMNVARDILKGLMDEEDLVKIEAVFETYPSFFITDRQLSFRLRMSQMSDRKRMEYIWKNVIKNNGRFVLPKYFPETHLEDIGFIY